MPTAGTSWPWWRIRRARPSSTWSRRRSTRKPTPTAKPDSSALCCWAARHVPEDRYGLSVTTSSERAFELYCDALDRALADQGGAADLLRDAVEEDGGFALAWALLGLQQRGAGDITGGNKSIVRARALASGLGEREQSHVAVLERFVALDVLGCEAAMHDHLGSWPRDAVIVLQAHFLH